MASHTGSLSRLLQGFSRQSLAFLRKQTSFAQLTARASNASAMEDLAHALLSGRGEASGVAIATDLLAHYGQASDDERHAFFTLLADRFGPDKAELDEALTRYREQGEACLPMIARASEPRRQELLRRINHAPGATTTLVKMRADLQAQMKRSPGRFGAVDADFVHLFSSWFNRGFLTMEEITWDSPASLLERVIRYEAVHNIHDWQDLRNRLDPEDRRCFAFFHPSLPGEPLIFVEVALTDALADNIQAVLRSERPVLRAADATTAIFYSISNCQPGLKGISFGHFLIKQVAADLQRSLPNLKHFATLSPVPGFKGWLKGIASEDAELALLARLEEQHWWESDSDGRMRRHILRRLVEYLTTAQNSDGKPIDPVARFHLGNGARLEMVNWLADTSTTGLQQSAGIMVNYVYDLRRLEELHEAYAHRGLVATGAPFRKLAQDVAERTEPKGRKRQSENAIGADRNDPRRESGSRL